MSTAIHSGSFNRPAWRRWRDRLAHFGVTGWLGLAVIAFWAAAAIFGPAHAVAARRRSAAARCSRR